MIDQADDFEHLNTVARYRNRLDDIRTWYAELPDLTLTIGSQALDLSGVRGTTDRIPGGDALTMLGPWAGEADHGDDLPHPVQIVREWCETIAGQHWRTWAENWRWLWDHVDDILNSPWADNWCTDIDALWGRLAALTGNLEKPEKQMADAEALQAHAALIPDGTMLTLREADHFNPGIENRVKRDRNAERDRAHRKHTDPEYRCAPDRSRYNVTDLRRHYGFPPLALDASIV